VTSFSENDAAQVNQGFSSLVDRDAILHVAMALLGIARSAKDKSLLNDEAGHAKAFWIPAAVLLGAVSQYIAHLASELPDSAKQEPEPQELQETTAL
jgi:hypothetical protein